MNSFLLGMLGFSSPYFLTFVQTKELGGHVIRGESGHLVIKYGTYETESDSGVEKTKGFLKAYTVFNSSQIECIDFPQPENRPFVSDTCGEAKMIVAGMPNRPVIKHGSAIAFYRPSDDIVSMPEMEYFTSSEAYFSVLLHELSHSTGSLSRLARKSLIDNKGMHASRQTYAEEELVAEMSASFLNAHAGILETEFENSASYISGWLSALKQPDAKSWIIRAASQAQKAADYILNVPQE